LRAFSRESLDGLHFRPFRRLDSGQWTANLAAFFGAFLRAIARNRRIVPPSLSCRSRHTPWSKHVRRHDPNDLGCASVEISRNRFGAVFDRFASVFEAARIAEKPVAPRFSPIGRRRHR